jgi:carbonic anhydrase
VNAATSHRHWIAAVAAGAAMALAGCGEDDETVTEDTATQGAEADAAPDWSYSGDTGPEHWGSLSPAYAACSRGAEQSPIDLRDGGGAPPRLEVGYGESPLELFNNGHSVEASAEGDNTISLDGKTYGLDQFHFHAPSEHTLNGVAVPLELHFVNLADDGSPAVLGVLVEEGEDNPAWARFTDALADASSEGDKAEVEATDLPSLLPTDPASAERWSYSGSLTTPPCSEGVAWTVFAEPIEMSADQIAAFTAAYDATARPVQPLGERELAFGS